jgi:hypothetical protein
MIPEDIRGLALNDIVFPYLKFDLQKDIFSGYTIADIVSLGIEEIPNHPYIAVSSTAGSQFNSDIKNTLYTIPTATLYGNTLRVDFCWLSEMLPDGWAEVVYYFQNYVFLDGLYLHTGFGADPFYHDADSVEIYKDQSGNFIRAAVDTYISFDEIQTNKLKVRLKAKNDTSVCLRGIGFFDKGDDVFPPYVPYISRDPGANLYPDVVHSLLPVNDTVVYNTSEIGLVWQTSGASQRYRLQIDTSERFCSPLDIEINDTVYLFHNASPAIAYYWRVRGRNDFNYGSGEWSEIRRFTVKNSAAVEVKKGSASRIPSIVRFPDNSVFAIDVRASSKASLRIYDMQGRLLKTLFDGMLNRGVHRYIWNSPLKGQGLYILRVRMGTNHAETLFVMSR